MKRILGAVLFIGITFTMLVEVSFLVGWISVQDTLVDYTLKKCDSISQQTCRGLFLRKYKSISMHLSEGT